MALTITFRDTLQKIVPPWLQHDRAQKVLYSMAVQIDAFGDALVAGVKLRFPNLYSAESLPLLGRERRIRHGRTEADASYAARLNRWLTDHRRRGGPYAMLAQLLAHFAPNNFTIALVYFSGRRFVMDAIGAVVRDDIAWSPDANTAKWARWWLFYDWPTAIAGDGIWDDPGTWDDGGVWDSDLTLSEVTDLRLVPQEWNAAHPFGKVVLLTGDRELWDYPPGIWDDGGLWDDVAPVQLDIG